MNAYLVLLGGIIATAFAAVFIRLADAPALVIAAFRLGLASLVLLPVAAARDGAQMRRLSRSALGWALLSGLMLAVHFGTWITSLQYTSVASSVVIVTSSPVWVALASVALLRERLKRITVAGIALAVAGGALIGGGDLTLGGNALYGDLLALVGAWSVAGYFLLGRRLRHELTLVPYIATVYSVAALALLAAVLAGNLPLTGYSAQTYLMFVLLAAVPQLLGHSAYNFALRHLSATLVSVATLGEPIGSTLLAALILGEQPPAVVLIGGLVVLGGIALVTAGERT
ncbi:MAG: DMT family transporter [Chloroflexi bacterium]|nr:DMT family transporter [Chloroflexota bacterium]